MKTLHGLARDVAATIRAGGLIPAEPLTLEVSVAGDPLAPGERRSTVVLRFDPRSGVGEVRSCPGGRWADRARFDVAPAPEAEADEDRHVATVVAIRADLAEFAAGEFAEELAEARP